MSSPTILMAKRKPQPNRLFRAYWRFAAERQRIFRARLASEYDADSIEPILRKFKFTNAYRASDRTSQFLIRHVIYDVPDRLFRDSFARVVLFKIFNRIETWELLEGATGSIDADAIEPDPLSEVLHQARASGQPIYSAAYIMPSPSTFGSAIKHENHLRLLRAMLDDHAHDKIESASSMSEAYNILLSYPSIGPFLAYQLVIDLNYSPHLTFPEDDFVVPGPGAADGLKKCFSDFGDLSGAELIRWTMERQNVEFEASGVDFMDLWGRELQLVDCQNLYCEVGKYARAAHPGIHGGSGRTRIKQRFRPKAVPLTAWYPPKWGINGAAQEWMNQRQARSPSWPVALL